MRTVFKYMKPYLLRMSVGISIKFFGAIMDLLIPWMLAYIIDEILPLKIIAKVVMWGGLMLVASLFAASTNIVANAMAASVSRDITGTIRHDLFSKICSLSSRQVDTYSVPTLISRMTSDTYNVHQMLSMMQRIGIRAPILLIGGIVVTLSLDPVLTLVLIATMPFIAAIVYFVSKKGVPLYAQLQKKIDVLVRKVREVIGGIRVIKALSKEDYEQEGFSGINADAIRTERKAGTTMAISNPAITLLLNIGLVFIIVVGAWRVQYGLTEVGKIIAFLTYFTIILNAMLTITRIFTVYSKAVASADRIEEILRTKEDLRVLTPGDASGTSAERPSEYHIEFDHVSFRYEAGSQDPKASETDEKSEDNLSDISFRLRQGESLGIIGSTGSGKTTVVNLLMRFYDARKGEIRIHGQPIQTIDKDKLHRMFGVVFQNDILFEDTIYENIRFGRELSEQNIVEAAESAMAGEFISNRSDSFQSDLSIRGANLSGGQKQRLLISRALAGKPEILILDDSSSALDYRTDAMIRKALHDRFANTTKIVVAQRVSSVMSLDHILVLEDGEEIGYGTHEELMEHCEIYREISKMQMGGGNDAAQA